MKRLIAFYLPQYHPIPLNDQAWGKGFTEWTNVAKAKPLYRGHLQPHLPSDLGYYDLRVPETREAQAHLARSHGVEAFCYWHYWFGEGRRLLERPFQEVLDSGSPDFPFCLAWANETWTGIWHGCGNKTLMEQRYPGKHDCERHFEALLPAFQDKRYVTVDGKRLFAVYKPTQIPDPAEFTGTWNDLARQAGLEGFYFVGVATEWNPQKDGFDACVSTAPGAQVRTLPRPLARRVIDYALKRTVGENVDSLMKKLLKRPMTRDYAAYVNHAYSEPLSDYELPVVVSNWDNTPRSGANGLVLENSTPELFKVLMRKAFAQVESRDPEHRIVFLKSWNEWAEGNYVEPDRQYGTAYLEAIKEVLAEDDRACTTHKMEHLVAA